MHIGDIFTQYLPNETKEGTATQLDISSAKVVLFGEYARKE